MANEITVVSTQKILDRDFTVYGTVEEPLFLAKDVAEMIGYNTDKVNQLVLMVEDDEKLTTTIYRSGRKRNMWFLTEAGLYEILMQSRKPVAKDFKKAVKELLKSLRLNKIKIIPTKTTEELSVISEQNKIAEANIWLKLSEKYKENKNYSQILDAYATKALENKFILPLPSLEEKNYTAKEVGEMLGISSHQVGHIAKELGIKIDGEYGHWYIDKSPYSNKEVNSFRYTKKVIDAIRAEIA